MGTLAESHHPDREFRLLPSADCFTVESPKGRENRNPKPDQLFHLADDPSLR
jgi:hypothetical protein